MIQKSNGKKGRIKRALKSKNRSNIRVRMTRKKIKKKTRKIKKKTRKKNKQSQEGGMNASDIATYLALSAGAHQFHGIASNRIKQMDKCSCDGSCGEHEENECRSTNWTITGKSDWVGSDGNKMCGRCSGKIMAQHDIEDPGPMQVDIRFTNATFIDMNIKLYQTRLHTTVLLRLGNTSVSIDLTVDVLCTVTPRNPTPGQEGDPPLIWTLTRSDASQCESGLYIDISLVHDYASQLHAVHEFKSARDIGHFFAPYETLNDVVLFVSSEHGYIPSRHPKQLPPNTRLVNFTPIGNPAVIFNSATISEKSLHTQRILENTWQYIMAVSKMRAMNTTFKTTNGDNCTTPMGIELINRRSVTEMRGELTERRDNDDPIFTDMTTSDKALTERQWNVLQISMLDGVDESTSVSSQGLTIHDPGEHYNDQGFLVDGDLDMGVFIGFMKDGKPEFVFINNRNLTMKPPEDDFILLSDILASIIPDLNRGLSREGSHHNIWVGHQSCRTPELGQLSAGARRLSLSKSTSMNCYLKSFLIMILMTVYNFDEESEDYRKSTSMPYDELIKKVAHGEESVSDVRIEKALDQINEMAELFAGNAIMGMPDFFNYLMKHSSEGLDLIRGWVDISGEWGRERSYDTSQKEYKFIVRWFGKRHSTRETGGHSTRETGGHSTRGTVERNTRGTGGHSTRGTAHPPGVTVKEKRWGTVKRETQ